MAPCCGRSSREKCGHSGRNNKDSRQLCLGRSNAADTFFILTRGSPSGTTVMPGYRGSSIALTTVTRQEMTGRIIGTARPKWRPWSKSKQASAVASVRDMRAISSLSSFSSNNSHHSSKCSHGRKRMSGLTRMPALARRSSGRSIRLIWPWKIPVFSTPSSRVSRQII
jgi:hypothetical protein